MCPQRASALRNGPLIEALEREPGSACLLSLDLTILYVNQGWRRFAEENGAPQLAGGVCLDAPITSFISEPLRDFFARGFERVAKGPRMGLWSHVYECSSSERYRKFNMQIQSNASGDALSVVHSRVCDTSLGAMKRSARGRCHPFRDARGLIVACSACGRVRQANTAAWDWAPGLIRPRMTKVSHGMCPICELQYYGDGH